MGDKKWFSIIKEINPKDVASKRSEMLTQNYLELAWKGENIDENTKRERDKENTEYCDDGWGKYSSMSQYYYANSLDHYLTHLVYGIVATQVKSGDASRTYINFGSVFNDIRGAIDEMLKRK